MIDYEARAQKREDIAHKQGIEQGLLIAAKNYVDSLHNENPNADYSKIVNKAKQMLDLDYNIVKELQKIYCK